jgi:hypothetical protein
MVEFKSICPKWHFGQVGHEGKKTIGGFFLSKFPVKKVVISCSVFLSTNRSPTLNNIHYEL